MSDEKMDRSESGSPIYHHQQRERGFEFAIGDDEAIKAISSHIGNFIGEPKTIFHELVSDLVHVDIHLVEPTPARNYY